MRHQLAQLVYLNLLDRNTGSEMDTFVANRGLSHIADQIFANLNHSDITKCRLVNDDWKNFIDGSKYIWRSVVNNFYPIDCEDEKDCFAPWKQVVRNNKGFKIKDLKVLSKFLQKLQKLHKATKFYGYYKMCCLGTFELACQFGTAKLCDVLLTYAEHFVIQRNALLVATEHKRTKIVKYILENYLHRIKINAENSNRETALHHACSNGSLEVVELLMKKNIKFSPNSVGGTPLHLACEEGHFEIAEILTKSNMNIHTIDMSERSALHEASENGHIKIVKLLIDNGLNVNADDIDGKTPLHYACYEGNLEVAKYLLSKGADVNALCFEGNTALHFATEQNHFKIVKALLETSGIKTHVENELCSTPQKIAEEREYTIILKLFDELNVIK